MAEQRVMPSFTKAPPDLVERFEAVAERHPDLQRRKMFGYPALFLAGNLVSGLFADRWMVRLAPADLDALLDLPDAAPFAPAPGRTMRGYGVLPRAVVADDTAMDEWLERAAAHVRTLPAK